mmetsp:Transcript_48524/g.149312  ORF Transcript_48524/g.149312 Transcript_48524/m.149312 type:complete len:320 (-) Transcript_48524:149-1108(-)
MAGDPSASSRCTRLRSCAQPPPLCGTRCTALSPSSPVRTLKVKRPRGGTGGGGAGAGLPAAETESSGRTSGESGTPPTARPDPETSRPLASSDCRCAERAAVQKERKCARSEEAHTCESDAQTSWRTSSSARGAPPAAAPPTASAPLPTTSAWLARSSCSTESTVSTEAFAGGVGGGGSMQSRAVAPSRPTSPANVRRSERGVTRPRTSPPASATSTAVAAAESKLAAWRAVASGGTSGGGCALSTRPPSVGVRTDRSAGPSRESPLPRAAGSRARMMALSSALAHSSSSMASKRQRVTSRRARGALASASTTRWRKRF